jgi:hypothetical protein
VTAAGGARRRAWLRAGFLLAPAAIFALLYARSLGYGLVWMDETEIGQGEVILQPGTPWSSAFTRPLHRGLGYAAVGSNPYYRPLQILVASAVYRAAGPDPRPYHALALGIGAVTCVAFGALAWLLLRRLDLAVLAALLAAMHPAGLESYAWISGLSEAMAALFIIASVGLGLIWVVRGGATFGVGSGIALILALFSKEQGVVVPALLLAAVVGARLAAGDAGLRLPAERRAPLRRAALLVGVQLTAVAVYALVWRPHALGQGLRTAPPIGGSDAVHLLTALATWPFQLAFLLAPLHPSTSDVVRIAWGPGDPRVWLGLTLPALSLLLWVGLLRAGRPVAALGIAWIWIAYLPTANLLPQIHARADRYLFLSVFGAALLVVDGLDLVFARASWRARRAGVAAVAVGAALGLAAVSWNRMPDWRSTRTLFERDVERAPDFREGRFHLARVLFEEGRPHQAARHIEVLTAAPPPEPITSSYANEIGVQELACDNDMALRRPEEAAERVRSLERTHPALAGTPGLQTCLGQALEALGQEQEALAIYLAVVEHLPGDPPPSLALLVAHAAARLGHNDEARTWLERGRRGAVASPALAAQVVQVERLLR